MGRSVITSHELTRDESWIQLAAASIFRHQTFRTALVPQRVCRNLVRATRLPMILIKSSRLHLSKAY